MIYPTAEQVEAADREQLARWSRFLTSPGSAAVGRDDFAEVLDAETKTLHRIMERFLALGGWTPELSKSIGWGK